LLNIGDNYSKNPKSNTTSNMLTEEVFERRKSKTRPNYCISTKSNSANESSEKEENITQKINKI
jgi:hypothetical protein